MVTIATAIGRTGLQDWLLQRISALILIAYTFYVTCFFCKNYADGITYSAWHNFTDTRTFKIFTFLAVINLIVHAWIGIWTVSTDYLKPIFLRLSFQGIIVISYFAFIIWAFIILWGS